MPGIIAQLVAPISKGRKLYISQKAITGTGTFSTGFAKVESGGALVTVANTGTTAPFDAASISAVSGGSFDVLVIQETGSGHLKETGAIQVNAWAVGV